MVSRGLNFNRDDYDENGAIKDGRSVHVDIMMADSASPIVNDAYARSVADLNAWRDAPGSAPVMASGKFAPLRADQHMTTDGMSRIEAQADSAFDRSVADLNSWRNA